MADNQGRMAPGDYIDQYQLVGLVGRGRRAEVFRALHPVLKRAIALKVYHPQPPFSDEETTIFQSQAQRLMTLSHPNLLRVHDFGHFGEWNYIVMDLIEGQTLRDLVAAHPNGLDRATTTRIFSQVASAVAHAHDHNVLHGNIKPDNILLDATQRPILADFYLMPHRADAPRSADAYLSPQQAAGAEVTPACDIYALGATLYEMITGDVPAPSAPPSSEASPRPPSQLVAGLDPRLEKAVLMALAPQPDQRYASARDMLWEMETPAAVGQFDTLTLSRSDADEMRKRRSEIRRFEESRVDLPERAARSERPAAESSGPQRAISPPVIVAVVLALIALIVIALLLASQG